MFSQIVKRPICCILPCLLFGGFYVICTFYWYNSTRNFIQLGNEIYSEPGTAGFPRKYGGNVTNGNSTRALMTTFVLNNPDLCNFPDPSTKNIVIVVLSARANFNERKLIRETYGSIKTFNDVTVAALVFFLGHIGQTGENSEVSGKIDEEFDQYGDIVSGLFTDTYRNLTRKAIMAYEWLSMYCTQPELVIKTDDDVIVNIFKLTSEIAVSPTQGPNTFRCWIHNNEGMIRDTTGPYERYHVTYDQIPGKNFPKHCAGVGYTIRSSLVPRLLTGMYEENELLVTHEDVYITGILPPRINSESDGTDAPIYLEDFSYKWYRYHPNNGVSDITLLKLSTEKKYGEVDGAAIFNKAYGNVLFFLVEHSGQFEKEFLELWNRILINTFVTNRSVHKKVIKQ